jgi:hypothetical protein
LGQRERLARLGLPGQKEIREILATLGQREQLDRPERLEQRAQKGHREFKGSKETPEKLELFPQLLP